MARGCRPARGRAGRLPTTQQPGAGEGWCNLPREMMACWRIWTLFSLLVLPGNSSQCAKREEANWHVFQNAIGETIQRHDPLLQRRAAERAGNNLVGAPFTRVFSFLHPFALIFCSKLTASVAPIVLFSVFCLTMCLCCNSSLCHW